MCISRMMCGSGDVLCAGGRDASLRRCTSTIDSQGVRREIAVFLNPAQWVMFLGMVSRHSKMATSCSHVLVLALLVQQTNPNPRATRGSVTATPH